MSNSIRPPAIQWFDSRFPEKPRPVHASKFYPPDESWTQRSAWWFEIPLQEINDSTSACIHLLCQKDTGVEDFHYLKVPVEFLKRELQNLDVRTAKDVVSLFLSAELHEIFVDKRGSGLVCFAVFKV